MSLGAEDLRRLDRLLDEAIDLPTAERAAWLDALAPEHARLAPKLRELLARAPASSTADILEHRSVIGRVAEGALAAGGGAAPGDEVGPYRLVRELGIGGMGVVWLGERTDGLFDRAVALKLPLFSARNSTFAQRFARERAILARLAHPNIARLYDAGVARDGQPYLALEYVRGEPLAAWCDARTASVQARLRLVVQVLRAVQYAHANLVVHRDLKPSNILVTDEGEVRLLDFGIAKLMEEGPAGDSDLTRLGGRALTPAYAAPELLNGQAVSTASDVYSVGVILYEVLSGRRPYRVREATAEAMQEAFARQEIVRPSRLVGDEAARLRGLAGAAKLRALLAGDLDTIVLKALKPNPEERYATAAALADDIDRYLRGEAIEARADSSLYRLAKTVSRHRGAFAAASLVALALVAGATAALWKAREASREAARAAAVQAFLLDLFRANSSDQPDPMRSRQRTARELLDQGRARIAVALREQPHARLELLGTLSGLYDELGLWNEARELSAQRVGLARELYGADDLRVATALSDLVRHADMREESASAVEPMIAEALRIHDLRGDHASLERAVLHARAAAHHLQHSLDQALAHASRSVEIFRAVGARDPRFPQALDSLGLARLRRGELLESVAAQEEALAISRELGVGDFRLLVRLRRAGEANAFAGRGEEADALLREALAMSERINGPQHSGTLSIRRTMARNLGWMGRSDEAAAQAGRVIAELRRAGAKAGFVRDTHRILFEVHWGRGDVNAARDGVAAALAAHGGGDVDRFEHAGLLMQDALVDSAHGRFAQAEAKLASSQAAMLEVALPPAAPARVYLAVAEGQVRLAMGDPARAVRVLEAVRSSLAGKPEQARSRLEVDAALVDAHLALGDLGAARSIAARAAEELARAPRRQHLVEASARVERALGRIDMAEGEFGRALPRLEQAARQLAAIHVDSSPLRMEVEAWRALCVAQLALPWAGLRS
jgi:serine/threonine-protein kinase